ncbi:UDP-glucose 6-dehydrogenase YwqF [Alphaproteobacteria bacterium SO-S41]|nr:UDP-glucose 6-dehydrogenase YwqF [Alphaproteobacteria bacterium SO-S41]
MKIAVAGAGYVGLVTAAGLARAGHHVVVAEIDAARRAIIASGRAPFFEPGLDELLRTEIAHGRLALAASTAEAAATAEVTFIAVGTPDRDGAIDLSQVRHAATEIGASLRLHSRPHTVVVKSTVVPGTTADVVGPALAAASSRPRGGFGLAMNPEFLREGTSLEDFVNPDRIVIGADDALAEAALQAIYAGFDCRKIVTSSRTAEFTKYMNNALLGTLVSFSNEMAGIAEQTPGVDFDAVISGVHADRRLTPMEPGAVTPGILSYLKPSAGYGGSCLPKDIAAIRAAARTANAPTPLLDAVHAVNEARADAVVALLAERIDLRAARIAILGAAFKAGTDDLRSAASVRVATALIKARAKVIVHDPLCDAAALTRAFPAGVQIAPTTEDGLAGAHAAIVMTAAPDYRDAPWARLARVMRTPILLDVWNICRGAEGLCERLRLGFAPPPAVEELIHVAG